MSLVLGIGLPYLSRSFEVWLQLLQQVRRCQLGLGDVVSDSDEPGPGPGELSSHLGEPSGYLHGGWTAMVGN